MIATLAVLLLLAPAPAPPEAPPPESATPVTPPESAVPATPPESTAPESTPPQTPPVPPMSTAPEDLRYPLGRLAVPDFAAAGDPFTLTDLQYSLDSQDSQTTHSFAARVLFKNWGYLGAETSGERRGLTLTTHRFALSAFDEQGRWDLAGAFRTSHLIVGGNATRAAGGGSWRLEPSLSFRLGTSLELEAWALADTQRPGHRLVTQMGGDVSWLHGSRLGAFAEVTRSYALLPVGVAGRPDENRQDSGRLVTVAQLGLAEITGQFALEDVTGRFPRRNTDGALAARVPLFGRLLLEGSGHGRFDNGAGELAHDYAGALTWYGRQITLPRAGKTAERALLLARDAARRGEYELPAFDQDALREQRLRLALSPQRDALREQMAAVYRAEVEERPLPLLGVSYLDHADELTGETVKTGRVFLGVPWPLALPWRAGEGAVRFLELAYEHEWHTTAPSSSTVQNSGADRVSLTVALNRELDLVVSYRHAQPTALDIIRSVFEHQQFTASVVYARGR